MIGLIRLTGPDGSHFFLNPGMITFFAPNSTSLCESLGIHPERSTGRGSVILIGGIPIQVQEVPNAIINALTRLRKKAEDNLLDVRKRADREPWEEDDEDDECENSQ